MNAQGLGMGDKKVRIMIGMFHDNGQNTKFVGNTAAGSERSGYSGYGISCYSSSNRTLLNEAMSCLAGFWFDATYIEQNQIDCVRVSNFMFWKIYLYAVFGEIPHSIVVRVADISVADAKVGIHLMLAGNSALSESLVDKTVHISNSLFVGASSNNNGCVEKTPSLYTCNMTFAYCGHLNGQVHLVLPSVEIS
jgi:hypothetical protein